ncbi:MAG TPA: RHS repeat-associated core domain-containing protein, partial [Jatrophihabitans sp.]|nr:RHS repeat-associated core domain-containing protein [Jatrophihabitans sp.]
GNRSQVVLDAMGEVVATVRMGKVTEQLGDSAQGCVPDLDPITVRRILADPLGAAAGVLGSAGTRTVYDRFAFLRGDGPAGCLTIARQTHLHELGAGEQTRVQCELTYSDGFGRVVQKKLQAEPDADRGERWIGSGWTVFDDKARPIRRFEPFFTSTPAFENERRAGVSALLCYDPVGRVVTTLHPDGTFEKVIIGPWEQTTWDAQDTVLLDPRTDPDVCGYLAGWLGTQPAWRTWYDQRVHGERGRFDQQAAAKASRHAATPGRSVLDPLGRELVAIAHNGWAGQRPVLFTTRGERDVEGNLRVLRDAAEHPDPAGRVCLRVDYDLVGQRVREVSGDAGERWILPDCLGNPLRVWDGRGLDVRNDYDRLRRPVAVYVTGADPDRPGAVVLTERLTYGEELPDAAERNLRHRLYRQRDQAGVLCTESVDFKGNVTASSRALAAGYADIVDWSGAPALEPERWLTTTEYDAFDRPVLVTAPGLPDRPGSVLRYSFNDSQLLCRVEAQLAGRPEDDGSWTTLVSSISYDARSQRTAVHHGNGTVTRYRYDPLTFRTVRLCTRRGSGYVQDLRYTYDAIANITHIEDRAQDPVFFRNQRVDPSADYTYDAVYRLVRATGRELVGHADHPDHPTGPHNTPADAKAVARYEQCYVYDPVGNLLELTHRSRDRHHGGWTRRFEVGPDSNRLTGTSVGDGPAEHLESDANGNTVRMPHLHLLSWDYRNRLRAVQRQRADGPAERTFYSYDAGGARVRKVTRRGGTVREERIYLGGLEIYRRHSGKRAGLVRESLHVMDARQRVAIIETRGEVDDGTLPRVVRYQYADHLASVALELDERARTITYEEFTPYGSSAYRAARRRLHPPKRYRFCGQERDDESGFNYHGARYLAPWLGRWISPDPQGLVDGPNRFAYARGNPVGFVDPSGTDCDPSQQCCVDDSLTTPREDAAQACLADPGEPVLFSAAAPNSSSMSSSPAGSTTQDSALSGYSVASLGVNVTAAGIRYAYLPRDAAGNPLQGPLNLYSGATARASAQAADGYMIKDTVYYAPADAAENALRARLGIPTGNLPVDEYNAIWGEASRLAVRDAAISSSVGTHNDLATLDPDSIQAIYELPTNRSYGSGMGGLNVVGGGLSIWGAAHDDTSWRSTLGYTGGGMQVAGGGMMIVGALETAPRLVSGGRLLGTAGAVITAPIVLSQAYDDVTSGDQYRQLNGTLKGAGVVFPPAAFLSVYNDAFVKPAAETFYDVACRDIADMLGVPRSWVY